MNVAALVAEVHTRLRAMGTPDRRAFMARSCPSAMETLGVRAPDIRKVFSDVSEQVRGAPLDEIKTLARALVNGGTLEGRQVGYLLLDKQREALTSLTLDEILALGQGIDNWASVDTFATLIAGSAWRLGRISDATVHGWLESHDRWWRRVAVVCTVALNQKARGATGDPARTLAVCEQVVADHDDMVVKALSWALRELAKREPALVREFLARQGDALASRVRREVHNKLETGLKNRRSGGEEKGR